MTLSNNTPPQSFLTKLATLRDFVTGMGIKASEDVLSNTLKNSGHNVELALERILSGNNFGGVGAPSQPISSSKKRTSIGPKSSTTTVSSTKTPRSNIKRQKFGSSTSSNKKSSYKNNNNHNFAQVTQPTNRLLLCKRWTVACSKSSRGSVKYGEVLDFTENWKNNNIDINNTTTPNKQLSFSFGQTKSSLKSNKPMDPLVRFRSKSGYIEGTLNRYLCSILVPLLHIPSNNTTNNEFIPLISIEGETLMEDTSLVMGSEIPLTLKVYINDPIGFFELFTLDHKNHGVEDGKGTSSRLFFQGGKKNSSGIGSSAGGGSKMPSYQTKKAKSSYTNEEVSEAAFHLLQWAEKGEELPFNSSPLKRELKDADGEEVHDAVVDMDVVNAENSTKNDTTNGDGDYEENSLVSEQVNELNQLVVSGDGDETKGKSNMSLPELKDPTGFKSNVTLRPYQRQALHWMCHREGVYIEGEMSKEDNREGGDGELDLLAELASSTYSSSVNSSSDVQVWGGKPISCDCGPVVVSDESMAARAAPVIEYGQKKKADDDVTTYVHHPLWKRRFLATDDMDSVFSFYVNELLGTSSATAPDPPKQCVGGILADAMGLGKTVMLLSLILKTKENEDAVDDGPTSTKKRVVDSSGHKHERASKRRSAPPQQNDDVVDLSFDIESDSDCKMEDDDDDDESYTDEHTSTTTKRPSLKRTKSKGTTLVIAPLSLISQWEEELATKTDLSHLVYYENTKKATGGDTFSCCDVVVTTYGTIQSEFASLSRTTTNSGPMKPGQSQPLLQFSWKRIILDEAHGIKNPNTVVSRACCMLKADTRWCVTGTPIQNSLQDVFGLLKFLRHEPWCDASFWRNAITNGSSAEKEKETTNEDDADGSSSQELATTADFSRVRRVLYPLILRRTKDTLSEDGTPILTLPPIDHQLVNVTLSPAEREFYNALLERSQSVFEGFISSGTASKSWFAIFSLLQRLRQACDHVSLTVSKKLETSEVARLKRGNETAIAAESSPSHDGEESIDDNVSSTKYNGEFNGSIFDNSHKIGFFSLVPQQFVEQV